MIELSSISKHYVVGDEKITVLNNISLSIARGEFTAIMGPSGSGKSTLMNIIGCLDRPTEGKYMLNENEISNLGDFELSNIRNQLIGFVFQNFELIPRMSSIKNVEVPSIYAGIKRKKRKELALSAMQKVGLADRIHHQPSQLSGGQKQRVAIARALINKPDIMIADEPTGSLDTETSHKIMELFRNLNDEGVTVIIVTHDHEVAKSCRRIVRIKDGMISEGNSSTEDEGCQDEHMG